MTVIVCLSDGGGMTFNKRRQSRDAAVIGNIERLVCDGALFISDFSLGLFSESSISVIAATNPVDAADTGDFVFLEDRGVGEYKAKMERLVIYRWNRRYPSDFKFDISPEAEGMKLLEETEFPGNSHEKITREIWVW